MIGLVCLWVLTEQEEVGEFENNWVGKGGENMFELLYACFFLTGKVYIGESVIYPFFLCE